MLINACYYKLLNKPGLWLKLKENFKKKYNIKIKFKELQNCLHLWIFFREQKNPAYTFKINDEYYTLHLKNREWIREYNPLIEYIITNNMIESSYTINNYIHYDQYYMINKMKNEFNNTLIV